MFKNIFRKIPTILQKLRADNFRTYQKICIFAPWNEEIASFESNKNNSIEYGN